LKDQFPVNGIHIALFLVNESYVIRNVT